MAATVLPYWKNPEISQFLPGSFGAGSTNFHSRSPGFVVLSAFLTMFHPVIIVTTLLMVF